jgi:drug/metabolite transporter (DMT)-like permease
MILSDTKKAYLQIHIAVLLYGFTAILGDLIQLSSLMLVWWRVLIACSSLFLLLRFGRSLRGIPPRLVLTYLFIGFIVGIHWLSFFGAVKLSNASVTLVCMATTSFFTSLIEPLFLRKKISQLDTFMGALIIPAMFIVIRSLDVSLITGAMVALISAFLASVFSVLNKKYVEKSSTLNISFIELGGVFLCMSIILPFWSQNDADFVFMPPSIMDWMWLLILGLLCTTLAWWLSIRALRQISAFASVLVINMEPVYGIILAAFILKDYEQLSVNFYIGSLIIILIVFLYPYLSRKQKLISNEQKS